MNCAGAGQPGRVWQARPAQRVAMLPGEAGINVRKTARYAGKDCDPLHLTAGQKSAEGIVGHVVGKASEALRSRKGESTDLSLIHI